MKNHYSNIKKIPTRLASVIDTIKKIFRNIFKITLDRHLNLLLFQFTTILRLGNERYFLYHKRVKSYLRFEWMMSNSVTYKNHNSLLTLYKTRLC